MGSIEERTQRVSDFLFIPLRPFFYAALAKRWKVQFRKGLRKNLTTLIQKRHILMRTAVLYIYIYSIVFLDISMPLLE